MAIRHILDGAGRPLTDSEGNLLIVQLPNSLVNTIDGFNTERFHISARDIAGVRSLKKYIYDGNEGLVSIEIPSTVIEIGERALSTKSLTSIAFEQPSGLKKIGERAFAGSSISRITFPDTIIEIGKGAFDSTPWFNAAQEGLVYAGKVVYTLKGTLSEEQLDYPIELLQGTKGIAEEAFANSNIRGILIPDSVEYIGRRAFAGCTNLYFIQLSVGEVPPLVEGQILPEGALILVGRGDRDRLLSSKKGWEEYINVIVENHIIDGLIEDFEILSYGTGSQGLYTSTSGGLDLEEGLSYDILYTEDKGKTLKKVTVLAEPWEIDSKALGLGISRQIAYGGGSTLAVLDKARPGEGSDDPPLFAPGEFTVVLENQDSFVEPIRIIAITETPER
jgi:hypothetical protein